MQTQIIIADYANPQHASDLVQMLDHYAQDPMGGGTPLAEEVKQTLATKLQDVPGAFTVLAYNDEKVVGLVNCIQGFSTFKAKPLINIHDVAVDESARGQGIAQKMLNKVEDEAKKRGCCKLTLEILTGNEAAKAAYIKFGFSGYELDPQMGHALFWEKAIK